jgi:V8-like Glu-specific endopeptidase
METLPTNLTVCGFDKNDTLMVHSNITNIPAAKGGAIYYDIDTAAGQSGSPVYYEDGETTQLVGIHKGYSTKEKLNEATLITN